MRDVSIRFFFYMRGKKFVREEMDDRAVQSGNDCDVLVLHYANRATGEVVEEAVEKTRGILVDYESCGFLM